MTEEENIPIPEPIRIPSCPPLKKRTRVGVKYNESYFFGTAMRIPSQEAPPVTDSIKCKEPGVVRASIPIHPSERLRKAIKDGYPPLNSPCDPFRDVSNSNCQSKPPSTAHTIILLMRPNAGEEV